MAYRVVPSTDPGAWDMARAREALLVRVRYTDLADPRVPIAEDSRPLLFNYVASLGQLAAGQLQAGDAAGCIETLRVLDAKVPLERVGAADFRPVVADLKRKALALAQR